MKRKLLGFIIVIAVSVGLMACEQSQPDGDTEQKQNQAEATEDQRQEGNVDELFAEVKNNAPTQERIEALEDIAMHYYWYGGDLKEAEEEFFQGITLHGDYDAVEAAFGQAAELDPFDLDLKYSLASAKILQKDIPGALAIYDEILNFDENHFEAQLMHAIYAKVDGDEENFQSDFKKLADIDHDRAEDYQRKIEMVEDTKSVKLNTDIPDDLAKDHHAFVALGYALSEDGKMEDTLIERLNVTKEAAEKYPDSKIIVSGGVPKKGHTEAELMYDWLVENGIDKDRIFKEDMATDTVENALFSMNIAKDEEVKDVTVISSATHMRRALAIFNEVSEMMAKKGDSQTDRGISNIVYNDFESEVDLQKVPKDEDLVIYRDFMRATGIWQFPGLQR